MVKLKFFRRSIDCEKCGTTINKSDVVIYDLSNQNTSKEGKRLRVCMDCSLELFDYDLQHYSGTAVVLSPIKGHNAYVTYSFEALRQIKQSTKESDQQNKDYIDYLSALQPKPKTPCDSCHKVAIYTWCSSALINHSPYTWKVNKDVAIDQLYLCPRCLFERFKKTIKDENIILKTLIPPKDEDAFLCSWDI